jgi:tetratricopeptide (TPR) repeat protein
MVNGLLFQLGELQLPVVTPPAVSARIEGLIRDPYDERYDEAALHSLSDDERLDELLEAHPLSRVRRWLEVIQQSLTVADDLRGDVVAPADTEFAASRTRQRISALALGVLFMQIGKIDRAEQHLAAGIAMRDGEPVLETPRLGDTLSLLGVTREALDRGEEAAWAHERAVRAFAAASGDDDPKTVRARGKLGRAYAATGRHAEAEPLLTGVIPVFESANNRSELAIAMNALGLVRQAQGRHTEAATCFGRALTLFEELHGPNYGECATVLNNLARSADATGDRVGSARALKRAEGIRWLQTMERR